MTTKANGACLCGAVKFEVDGPLRPVIFCHCEQCRRTSGHFVAATACEPEQLHLLADGDLRWFQSSSSAKRGFCANCGSSLFWFPAHGKNVSIMAGALGSTTGLKAAEHIYVASAAAYYSIDDGLPQYAGDKPLGP